MLGSPRLHLSRLGGAIIMHGFLAACCMLGWRLRRWRWGRRGVNGVADPFSVPLFIGVNCPDAPWHPHISTDGLTAALRLDSPCRRK